MSGSPILDPSDWIHTGSHSFGGETTLAAGSIGDAEVESSANIDADKVQHRHVLVYEQKNGTDVATETKMIFQARFAGVPVAVIVTPYTAPTGGDKAYTVDVKKCAQAGSMATILSAVVTMNSSDVDRTCNNGTISTTTFAAGDIFEVVVATSGSTGSQGQGLLVLVVLDENCA